VLGKRLGRDMGVVAKKVKEMSLDDILDFEKSGEVVISGHSLKLSDIKVYILCDKYDYSPDLRFQIPNE
jgi:isoleucyl-tRNA synthetase